MRKLQVFGLIVILCLCFWVCQDRDDLHLARLIALEQIEPYEGEMTDGRGLVILDTAPTVIPFSLVSFSWGDWFNNKENTVEFGRGKVYENIEEAPVCDICDYKHHVVFEWKEPLNLPEVLGVSHTSNFFDRAQPTQAYQQHFYCLDCVKKAFVWHMERYKDGMK